MADPLDPSSGDALAMTHWPSAPNPAAPYFQAAKNFAGGGLQRAMALPNNAVGRALQNPDNMMALGMMTPIKGAGVRMGRPAAIPNAANFNASIKRYKDALVLNKITAPEFEGFMEAMGADKSLIQKMITDAHQERKKLLQAVREQMSGMHEEGNIRGPDD